MNLTKSQADQMQNKVDSKKGSALCFKGSIATIKPKDKGKPNPKEKDVLKGLKSNNWIGSEDDFQIAVAKLLDSHNLDWFHCPNGGKRHVSVATKLKKMGVKAGIPDVIILNQTNYGKVGLCIELKVGTNSLTDSQKDWAAIFLNRDWDFRVAYDMESVESLILELYGI